MRFWAQLLVLAVLATVASAGIFKASEYSNLFARFTKTFSRQYASNTVKAKMSAFKSNLDKITLVNAKAPGTLHVNGLADMEESDFKKMLSLRVPASVYAAVGSIAAGKNRDGRNTAIALLESESDYNAPVNQEALAAVDAYAASFLDMNADSDTSTAADASSSGGNVPGGSSSSSSTPSPTSTTTGGVTGVLKRAGSAISDFFGNIRDKVTSWGKDTPEQAARKAAEAQKRAQERAAREDQKRASTEEGKRAAEAEVERLLAYADSGFDWRSRNVLGEARHQGGCGSCWAYTTVAAIEAAFSIKHKIAAPVLSEQHLLDCDSGNGGCSGGWFISSFKYAATNGLRTTAAYGPYKRKKETCRDASVAPYEHKIKGGRNIFASSNIRTVKDYQIQMIKAVRDIGPVAAAMYAPPVFQFWGKNILMASNCSETTANHAVVVVGFGRDPTTGTRFWQVRNSWGRTWGDGTGHFRLERKDSENVCAYHVGAYVPEL